MVGGGPVAMARALGPCVVCGEKGERQACHMCPDAICFPKDGEVRNAPEACWRKHSCGAGGCLRCGAEAEDLDIYFHPGIKAAWCHLCAAEATGEVRIHLGLDAWDDDRQEGPAEGPVAQVRRIEEGFGRALRRARKVAEILSDAAGEELARHLMGREWEASECEGSLYLFGLGPELARRIAAEVEGALGQLPPFDEGPGPWDRARARLAEIDRGRA